MTTYHRLISSVLIILLLGLPLKSFGDEPSTGYQLALLDERAQNPQKVLMQQKLTPPSATIREFEWILETLRSRCRNPQNIIVMTLVESWRIVQRRGYNVSLLVFSRQIADFSHIISQTMRNQKLDIDKVSRKLIKDKYPIQK